MTQAFKYLCIMENNMALGFALHQKYVELACAEIAAVVSMGGSVVDGMYITDVPYHPSFLRLAFTKAIYDVVPGGSGTRKKMLLADLTKHNRFEQRRAHLLPAPHPAMTHPRVARAMVNLSNASHEILDPFCGGGGILIEAGLCGLHAVGADIDPRMIGRARTNLQHFGIRDYELRVQDATTFSGSAEAIVTDLPYGMNTAVTDELEKLYLAFLMNVKRNRVQKVVVGFPDFVDYAVLVREAGLHIKNEFTYYLHRKLSKKITVIAP